MNILWPLGSFPLSGTVFGPWDHTEICLRENWGLGPAFNGSHLQSQTWQNVEQFLFFRHKFLDALRWCFRFRTPEVLSLLSEGFCCEISIRALAIARPGRRGKRQVNVWLDILGMATVVALVLFYIQLFTGSCQVVYPLLISCFAFSIRLQVDLQHCNNPLTIQQSDSIICINTLFFTFKNISNLGHMNWIHEEEQGPNKINWLWLWTIKLLCDKTHHNQWGYDSTSLFLCPNTKCVLKV